MQNEFKSLAKANARSLNVWLKKLKLEPLAILLNRLHIEPLTEEIAE
jgi:hypothetical protein